MSNFSTRIAGLSPQQKALLMERLRARKEEPSGGVIRPRAGRANVAPLSFAQERIWFLDRLEPGGLAYNLPFALRLTGPLDVPRLERCVNEIVARHEILRTTFAEKDGRPIQVIAPSLTLSVPVTDLRHLGAGEREAEGRRLVAAEAWRKFDLARGPLLSCGVLRLAEQEHVWMLTMHHIITDGWSIGVFVRELITLYEAFGRGEPSPLPPLPIQYADFVEWQHQWLRGQVLEEELSYWKQQLGGAPHRSSVPTDLPRPPVRSFRGARRSVVLPKAQADGLRDLARAEGATLFMALLTVYEVLLHYLSKSEDIAIGFLIANRNRRETEDLIGFFVNQLVLRTRFSGDPSFRELLGRLRQVTLDAFDHQELPYQRVVDALHVERDLSRNPLFQVNFTFQNTPITALKMGELTLGGLETDGNSMALDVDLSLLVSEPPDGLLLVMRYSTDLFTPPTIKRMLRLLEVSAGHVIAAPDTLLSGLTAKLAEAEREHLVLQLKQRKTDNAGRLDDIRRRRRGGAVPQGRGQS